MNFIFLGNANFESRKRPMTQGNQFKHSMQNLMKNLLAKTPNYIRCIKPNEAKRDNLFSSDLVANQVRYLGLLENIRVRRAGFAHRQTYFEFFQRYKMLTPDTWPKTKLSMKESTRVIVDQCRIAPHECAFGFSKIFIRSPNIIFQIEELRTLRLIEIIAKIQAQWRMYSTREHYRKMRAAQIKIAARWRGYKARRHYLGIRNCTIVIQSYYRGMLARQLLAAHKLAQRRIKSATLIAAYWRGYKCRKELRKYFRSHAAPIIARFMDAYTCRLYLLHLRQHLPRDSPSDQNWPVGKYQGRNDCFRTIGGQLRAMHHKWRCGKYMRTLSVPRQRLFTDKIECARLFETKALYRSQLPLVYRSDYINLHTEKKWEELNVKTPLGDILFADIIQKVNRSDGKTQDMILVLTSGPQVFLLAPDTLKIKTKIETKDIESILMSPYCDGTCALKIRTDRGKGDIIISNRFVMEFALRLFQAKQKSGQKLNVIIHKDWNLTFKQAPVQVQVIESMNVALPSYRKKNNRIDIQVPKEVSNLECKF